MSTDKIDKQVSNIKSKLREYNNIVNFIFNFLMLILYRKEKLLTIQLFLSIRKSKSMKILVRKIKNLRTLRKK